ncbi:MAG: S8 family peptidase [Anaerolineales bacterium]|nr:S8 family peptidase [Anaerolineales bacterium]
MIRGPKSFLLVGLLAFLMGISFAAPGETFSTADVVRYVGDLQEKDPQQLHVVYDAVARYPLTGKALTIYKVLDIESGNIYQVGVDSRGRLVGQIDEYRDAENTAFQQRYGKITPALTGLMGRVKANEELPVAIWATVPVRLYRVFLPLLQQNSSTLLQESIVQSTHASDNPKQSIVDFLQALGYEPVYTSQYTPVVYAWLPQSIIENLADQTFVAYMDQAQEHSLHLYSAARTIAAPWTWSRGFTGQGVTIAVIEGDGIDFNHPSLIGTVNDSWRYFQSNNPNFGPNPLDHATMVAGVIASTDATNRGIAYSSTVLSGNAGTNWIWDLQAASEWAISQGARILNYSWGDDSSRDLNNTDRVADWLVWERFVTIVVSAGNSDSGPNVASPAKGYNVIAVGAKDDKNTAASEGDVCDDEMSSFSAYLDPNSTHDDREKPDVVAVGQRLITTYLNNGWTAGSTQGTSFSAPAVASQAALMMSRENWLGTWPETVRAVIMASARWNVEGDRRLSDKDGAGGVDTTAADNSLLNDRMAGLVLFKDNLPYEISFEVTVPERIRVAIAWNSHPTSGDWWQFWQTDPLKADLDLTIYAPDGSLVGGSYSFDNSSEIVEFSASNTGLYKARISQVRWDNGNAYEYVGFGWYSGAELPEGCP